MATPLPACTHTGLPMAIKTPTATARERERSQQRKIPMAGKRRMRPLGRGGGEEGAPLEMPSQVHGKIQTMTAETVTSQVVPRGQQGLNCMLMLLPILINRSNLL